MLERIKAVLRERRGDDQGFSLVELAVVIVIIGILVAIAVPVFMNMQQSANDRAAEAAAANGSAMVAAEIAADSKVVASSLSGKVQTALKEGTIDTVTVTGNDLTDYCVTVAYTGGNANSVEKGPCP